MSKIKVFGVLNHLGNQYEMLKLTQKYDVKFSYLENNVRRWSKYAHRPMPQEFLNKDQFEWVTHYEPGKYDVAILHVDQQHVDPHIGKGQLYRQLDALIQDIPKIVINHGTPMNDEWDDEFTINGGIVQTNRGEKHLKGMRQLIGDNFMVVNSYESINRWGWGYPLIHGLDPNEWWDLSKEPQVTMSLSPGGLNKYYNRQLITAIKGQVQERVGLNLIHTNVNYKPQDWDEYRELLGTSLIGVYPFKDSPMPRSRTEAMLSGQCILSSKYHNADEFIEHGVNGFIVPDNPLSYAQGIYDLLHEAYREAEQIGQRAKQSAIKYFHIDDYHKDLYFIISEIANGRRPEWDGKKRWDK